MFGRSAACVWSGMDDEERKARPTQMLQRYAIGLLVVGMALSLCGGVGGGLAGFALEGNPGTTLGVLMVLGAIAFLVCTPLGLGLSIPGLLLLLLSFYASADLWIRGRMRAEEDG